MKDFMKVGEGEFGCNLLVLSPSAMPTLWRNLFLDFEKAAKNLTEFFFVFFNLLNCSITIRTRDFAETISV